MSSINKRFIAVQLFLIGFMLFGCLSPDSTANELKIAYENFRKEYTKAEINLDPTNLSQVATGKILADGKASIEQQKKFMEQRDEFSNIVTSSEAEIGKTFRVIEIKDDYAYIRTNVLIKDFTQNLDTGERTYHSERWYKMWVEMIKEDGIWKVATVKSKDYWD